jgi:uncharacterized protein (AIM24 family)
MEYQIDGQIAPRVHMRPTRGETLWISSGGLMAYSEGVSWTLKVPGGIGGAIRRSLAGEGIGLTYVTTRSEEDWLMAASGIPGRIEAWDLVQDGPVITTRGSFLAAWGEEIDINVTMAKRPGAALFGGAGLLLQKVSGIGSVLISVGGDLEEVDLQPGKSILVSSGNLAAMSQSIDYNIEFVGGFKKTFFGGEGLFMTKLTGPGKVLLQTLKRGVKVATSSS